MGEDERLKKVRILKKLIITFMILSALMIGRVSCTYVYPVETFNYTGATYVVGYGLKLGPVSNNIYTMGGINASGAKAAIRRTNLDNTEKWRKIIGFDPSIKSLAVDKTEQSVCFSNSAGALIVICMNASDGTVFSAIQR